ncbi:MAG: hypothetical protein AAGF13_01130 [Pseudomonadota bacterium]
MIMRIFCILALVGVAACEDFEFPQLGDGTQVGESGPSSQAVVDIVNEELAAEAATGS